MIFLSRDMCQCGVVNSCVYKVKSVCSESSSSRLAKPEKWKFTFVNDHFEGKRNDEIGLYGQTLIN